MSVVRLDLDECSKKKIGEGTLCVGCDLFLRCGSALDGFDDEMLSACMHHTE